MKGFVSKPKTGHKRDFSISGIPCRRCTNDSSPAEIYASFIAPAESVDESDGVADSEPKVSKSQTNYKNSTRYPPALANQILVATSDGHVARFAYDTNLGGEGTMNATWELDWT